MAIGLCFGRSSAEGDKERAYAKAAEFYRRFQREAGSVVCRELTGCDLTTPEGRAQFEAQNQHQRCTEYVATAVRFVVGLCESE
jgi:hypothetical protein